MSMPGPTELIIILVIVALIFGTTKIKNIGSDLGGAIKSFRKGLNEAESVESDLSKVGEEINKSPEDSEAAGEEINKSPEDSEAADEEIKND